MAASSSPPFFIFLAVLASFFLTHTFSRTLPKPVTHTSLDVSASLDQALHFLNTPTTEHEAEAEASLIFQSINASSAISLDLLSRESILKSNHHTDYKSLVLSRLRRDSARVNSLSAKLLLSRSDDEFLPQSSSELSTPITSGSNQGSGEYFSRIGVGTPPKPFYMVLDTGSDVNWLQCDPCADCYTQTDPIFNPSASSTYSPVSCDSPLCSSLELSSCRSTPQQCLYQVNYGDGSFTTGDFVTESVSFGSSASRIALGCGHDNEGLFVGAAGLLGLGGGPLSLTSQLKATSFSYCLVNRDSPASSSLDFNSAFPSAAAGGGDVVTATLIKSRKIDTFYYVGLSGISVGGQLLSIPEATFELDESGNGGIIVDCGTAITRLQTQAYSELRDAFVRLTPNLRRTSGVALFDTCYDMSGMKSVKVPTVAFHFSGGGRAWNLPAANYLIPVDSDGTFCFAFAPTSSSLSIIGNVQQQGTRVSFDLANKRVGFSTNKC
ncbi:Protein ASPARTIC PROTEASE IN GUARD CELL 1 [Linum perenne]